MKLFFHTASSGHPIAYRQQPGEGEVGVTFLPGYRSDMESSKATALGEWCAGHGVPFTVFDYFGHGKSEGDFIDFTIGQGIQSTLEVLDHIATGPQILVGSSMGGWIGLHAARERRGQVRGLIGIAAAPDFTEIMHREMTVQQREEMDRDGVVWVPGEFGGDYPISQQFLENGRSLCLLEDVIGLEIPVHLLQGQQDAQVPWQTALKIAECVVGEEVAITLIKDGEHRLSRPQDLALLFHAVERMVKLS